MITLWIVAEREPHQQSEEQRDEKACKPSGDGDD